ncbi:MAG: alpha/beta fold hydrolase, partial [Actinomycetota bacterium]
MLLRHRLAFVMAAVVVVSACGERLIFEASTDPTITTTVADSDETNATESPTSPDDSNENDTTQPGTISWESCSAGPTGTYECGYLDVPFDYANPSIGTFSLYLVRRLADSTATRIGSMLVNPGGPGFGGTVVAEQAEWYLSSSLMDRFDIVGWDPRGTGQSTPAVDCIDEYDTYFGIDSPPNDAAAKQKMIDLTQEFIDQCVARNGEMLKYISTEATARDIDSIRRALGEEKITYFGFSYGSELGATWATLFPDTVR